jgi:hypothetical protein
MTREDVADRLRQDAVELIGEVVPGVIRSVHELSMLIQGQPEWAERRSRSVQVFKGLRRVIELLGQSVLDTPADLDQSITLVNQLKSSLAIFEQRLGEFGLDSMRSNDKESTYALTIDSLTKKLKIMVNRVAQFVVG